MTGTSMDCDDEHDDGGDDEHVDGGDDVANLSQKQRGW